MWNDFKAFVASLVTGLAKNEEGQAMVEYALILSLVSVAALIALTAIGTGVNGIFNSIVGSL
jgi:pilus assembly protein Flp/PilA